jgi:hypothetical protein
MGNKMLDVMRPYMIMGFDITNPCFKYNIPYTYDLGDSDLIWTFYKLYKQFNFIYITGEADA